MSEDLVFRIIYVLLFFPILALSFYTRFKANKQQDNFNRVKQEGIVILFVLRLGGLFFWLMAMFYPIFPKFFNPLSFDSSVYVKIIGVTLSLLAIPLLFSVFKNLGNNISDTVETRPEHQLVTTGIYRYIRHPLYSVGILFGVGLGLIASNWLMLLLICLGFVVLIIRTKKEEELLIEKFGINYIKYKEKTGNFFPQLFKPKV